MSLPLKPVAPILSRIKLELVFGSVYVTGVINIESKARGSPSPEGYTPKEVIAAKLSWTVGEILFLNNKSGQSKRQN